MGENSTKSKLIEEVEAAVDKAIRETDGIQQFDAIKVVIATTLQAMMEPTSEMHEQATFAWKNRNLRDPKSDPIRDSYQAMINEFAKHHNIPLKIENIV